MEEQKTKSKEIKMNAQAQEAQPKKLSYEELNQACMELSEQNQQMQQYIQKLHKQMQQMDFALQTKRMDYLFKIIELSVKAEGWFSSDFVQKCLEEIQDSLTVSQEQEEPKGN